jgi:hypothetical protein
MPGQVKSKKIGRHKLRLFDDVKTYIRTFRIKRWIHKAEERQEWLKITRATKVKLEEEEREEQFN